MSRSARYVAALVLGIGAAATGQSSPGAVAAFAGGIEPAASLRYWAGVDAGDDCNARRRAEAVAGLHRIHPVQGRAEGAPQAG